MNYEQDNNTSNGKEDIEWLVLEKKGDRIFVISKYALDCQQYHTHIFNYDFSDVDVTWETCFLRKWLNGTFLNAAFTEAEQAMIPSVTVSADKNPKYNTEPGNATQDQVFLLSIPEISKFFSDDSMKQCRGTPYCYAQGAFKDAQNGNCWWWLRSPGCASNCAVCVTDDGGIFTLGCDVDGKSLSKEGSPAVRPALWIELG